MTDTETKPFGGYGFASHVLDQRHGFGRLSPLGAAMANWPKYRRQVFNFDNGKGCFRKR